MSDPVGVPRVEAELSAFTALLDPAIRGGIRLSDPYQMTQVREADADWPKGYGSIWGEPVVGGVYLHFTRDDLLLYVGMAVSLGNRLGDYFKHADFPSDKTCKIIDPELERLGACKVRVIKLDDRLKYLAPAIEWYLIEKLDPPINKQRKRKGAAS